jgi:hypothetical protein
MKRIQLIIKNVNTLQITKNTEITPNYDFFGKAVNVKIF